MRIRTFLHVLLILMVVFLCGKIFAAWRRPFPELRPSTEPIAPGDLGAGISQPVQSPEIVRQSVEVIATKDLFTADRGEVPPPIAEAPKTIEPPSHLKLVGVLMRSARAEAFLADSSQGNKVFRVKQGDSIGQYQLLQVDPKEVKLALGASGEVASLQLRILDSATSQQSPHIIPAVAQPNVGEGRPGLPLGRVLAQPNVATQPGGATQTQEEAQALRNNIQRMQQRLRRLRRRAAREEAQANQGGDDNEEAEEDSNDGE